MDKETRELLESIQNQILTLSKDTNNRFDKLENRLGVIETGQSETNNRLEKLEAGQNEIKALLVELDPKNANRHLELKSSIDELRNDLSTVEIVTASNYSDIAKLKRIK